MIAIELGRRYERLLFMTAPISLAAIFVCLISLAPAMRSESVALKCYGVVADVLEQQRAKLDASWTRNIVRNKYPIQKEIYESDLTLALYRMDKPSDILTCNRFIKPKLAEVLTAKAEARMVCVRGGG